jgi:lipopolysaccharide heptosyltransferase II
MLKVRILKKADALLGPPLVALLGTLKRRAASAPAQLRSVLVLRPGGIGDAVLLVPTLLALKEQHPQVRITVLAERRNAAAFALCPAVDRVLHYDRPSELLQALRGRYDLVIDTEQWHRLSALVARCATAPFSVGFATNERRRLFNCAIPYSHELYEAASFLNLLAPLGLTQLPPARFPFLEVPEQAARRAEQLLAPVAARPFAVIFPGASIAERRWGGVRFQQVAQHLALSGYAVVVVGGGDDSAEGEVIVRACGGLNLAGKTSLVETAAVLARSALLISGDSGVLHIAVGLGIPTVSLFGPGIEAKWGPKGEGHLVLNRQLSCSPCTRFGTTPPCPSAARCLSEITPEEVVSAARELLSKLRP